MHYNPVSQAILALTSMAWKRQRHNMSPPLAAMAYPATKNLEGRSLSFCSYFVSTIAPWHSLVLVLHKAFLWLPTSIRDCNHLRQLHLATSLSIQSWSCRRKDNVLCVGVRTHFITHREGVDASPSRKLGHNRSDHLSFRYSAIGDLSLYSLPYQCPIRANDLAMACVTEKTWRERCQ